MSSLTDRPETQGLRIITAIPETGYLRLPQVLQLIPVCRSTWLNGVISGRYPKPIKLSARSIAWRVEDIRELIERKAGGALDASLR